MQQQFYALGKVMGGFRPNYRGPREGPGSPFQAFLSPSGIPVLKSASGGPLQHQHLLQVVAYPFQPEVTSVAHLAHITTSAHPLAALQGADDPLHGPAPPRKEPIPRPLPIGYGSITPGPVDDAAKPAPASQLRVAGIFGIGPIGKHRGFVAHDHLLTQARLGDAGRSQSRTPQPAAALIYRKVRFVAEVPVFAPAGPIRFGAGAGL